MEPVSFYSEEGPLNKSRDGQEPAVSHPPESRQPDPKSRRHLCGQGRGQCSSLCGHRGCWLAPQCTCGCWLGGSSSPGFRASVGACSSSTDSLP